MNPAAATPDPLAGLRGYHLPEAVSWWPPGPGWWLLARWLPAAHPRLGKALRLPFYAELAGLEAGRRGGSGRPCAMPWPGPCWCWPPPDTNGWGSR